METNRPKLIKFVTLTKPPLPQYSIVNKDGSTVYANNAKLIRLVADGFQAPYEIIHPPDSAVGTKQPDGNWSGKLGMIIRSEADLAMGGLFITEERYGAMNVTFPHILGRITFITDKPQPVSKNMAIFYPFSYEIWITFFLFFAAVSFLFYALMKKKRSMSSVLLIVFGSIFSQSLDFPTKTKALKGLALSWSLGVMILVYSYQGLLLSFLSFPTLSGIRDIADLGKASTGGRFKCFGFRGSYLVRYFLESGVATWEAIGDCLDRNEVKTGDVFEAFHKSKSKKAFVGSSDVMSSYENDYFLSEDSFFIALCSIPFSSRFCCPGRLNAIVHRLVASGLINKIKGDEDFFTRLQRKSFESEESETTIKIRLDDISGAFYIVMAGWLLSFVVFFIEILIANHPS